MGRPSKWQWPATAIASAVAVAAAAAPPQQTEIAYEVARNGTVVAEVLQRLEHDGQSYRLREVWRGRGVYALRGEATRTSEGAVATDGLRPRRFEDQRSGRELRQASFDPASKSPTAQRQDRLSFVWSFAFSPPRAPVAVKVADGRNVTTYVYEPAGREKVRTPAGEFDALKLVKRRDDAGDKVTEIWLAAGRGYLPVRTLVVDADGTRIEQSAVRISGQ